MASLFNEITLWQHRTFENRANNLAQLAKLDIRTPTFLSTKLTQILQPHQTNQIGINSSLMGDNFNYHQLNSLDTTVLLHGFSPIENHNGCYICHFAGNGQDALDPSFINKCLAEAPDSAHYFWNYPKIGDMKNSTFTVNDRHEAGYKLLMLLIENEKIPANKIIIDSWSMGCDVALNVARKLYENSYNVGLFMDRGFIGTDPVIQSQIWQFQHRSWITIATSSLFLGTYSFIIIDILSKLVASIGVITNGAIFGVGVLSCLLLEKIASIVENLIPLIGSFIAMPIKSLGLFVKELFSVVGAVVDNAINLLASTIALTSMITVGVSGAFIGAFLGVILSVPQLFNFSPIVVPTSQSLNFLLKLNHFDLSTEDNLNKLVSSKTYKNNANKIVSINTMDDWLVGPQAALNKSIEENPSSKNINTYWFNKGSHGDELAEPVETEHFAQNHQTLLNEVVKSCLLR